jgi:formylmethanofuran dehydrogenase subunit E
MTQVKTAAESQSHKSAQRSFIEAKLSSYDIAWIKMRRQYYNLLKESMEVLLDSHIKEFIAGMKHTSAQNTISPYCFLCKEATMTYYKYTYRGKGICLKCYHSGANTNVYQ